MCGSALAELWRAIAARVTHFCEVLAKLEFFLTAPASMGDFAFSSELAALEKEEQQ
jgi:hypothetical protein